MADALKNIRSKFVNSVSKEVIHQLLDDLLEDQVLNDGEVEHIKEGASMRAEKARSLMDMVRKKGDAASNTMIKRLKERDPVLFKDLDLDS
ncbi:caspase-1-A-like [Scleropages formosus]|uniref:CARD domain-containing protein n=1 Tax=Scleropages formosus TaxID=113540 RepID=A0A8C9UZ92_SCLFO|nr:caspase recruitment domain-containing protein 8 [Scleropages formosus]